MLYPRNGANLHIFIIFLMIIISSFHFSITTAQTNTTSIVALLDDDTRIGKEMITALKLAVRKVNDSSDHQNLSLHIQNPGQNPLQAIYTAEHLISSKSARFIITNGAWAETALLASIGNQSKVPIISFAGSTVDKPMIKQQWPFLVEMVPDIKQQVKCIVNMISNVKHWRKVIVIYEVDSQGSDSGAFTLLSDALLPFTVEIEHRLVIPTFSSLSDPETYIRGEVVNLLSKQSRVFVVLKMSLESSVVLFREAKAMGLVGKESVWIISDPLAGLLDSVNSSAISTMDGALGVTTHFPENGDLFEEYYREFKKVFRADYPGEDNSEPSIYALRTHDSVNAIIEAIEKANTSILENLLSSNFSGLSGPVSFEGGELKQPSALKIVNVVGKKYKELAIWTTEIGFEEKWYDSMNWPGGLRNRLPKGWAMPNELSPLIIGVPGRTTFAKFVKVTNPSSDDGYTGFCIDIFREVLDILDYPLPHNFRPFNGSYDELVDCVANKTFDAVVGDITILANRSSFVEFTQPYTESGLTMMVTVKSQAENKAWIFVKPFTGAMWAVTGSVLLYTVLIVWLLERHINPEFDGPWWNQLNTAMWFTCSSLFFAHREKVYNNYTRVVVLVWLFVALVLTSSYTANFSSLLTVPRLIPSFTDIQSLKDRGAMIGCDGDSFVRKYLENVLHFRPQNIKNISSENDYPTEFAKGNIAAAFLELPYQKAFISHNCKGYTVVGNNSSVAGDRFGGLGFAFQKGSPLAEDVSRAILTLSENGRLKQLHLKYFSPTPECRNSDTVDSLDWRSFWGLFLFSAGISAICYVSFSVHWLYEWWRASDFIREARSNNGWTTLLVRRLHSRISPTLPG
ncbi:hypothetical protein CASFOL_039453 [Castilleja foliolosa]|uniref:Glutamate receptor n=1 Tax=Castilleja foliolosa TaxID=1961234 RepID=A0ABD3BIN8_9LAMI